MTQKFEFLDDDLEAIAIARNVAHLTLCWQGRRSGQMHKLLFWFLAITALTFAVGLIVTYRNGTPISDTEVENKPTQAPVSTLPMPDYVGRLTDAGWDRLSAEAVVALNSEWFDIQADENPTGLEIQLKLLSSLGKYRALGRFVARHPETAGLLAAAAEPELIAAGLDTDNENYQVISGLYIQHAAPGEANDIAVALKSNRDLICALHGRGMLGCEAIFIFDRTEPSSRDYESWLREAIEARMTASDAEFASFINLVMRHGRALRDRLEDSDEFRRTFRAELWPRLCRAVDGDHAMFEIYLDEDRIWDLIAIDNGEELVRRCGLLPIDLLYGHPEINHAPYPETLHPKIIQILLRREERALHALMKYRGESLFQRFMQRDLSADTFSAALAQLLNSGANYPEKLKLYARLSDTALADEVGPPAEGIVTWIPLYYTVYEVPKKLLQGREPTGMDLFSATVDPVFLVVDVFTGGGAAAGRKALLAGGKEATGAAARKLAEKGGEKLFVTTLRDTGLELAQKRVGKEVAEKMGEKELINWTVTGTLNEMQQVVRSALGKATTFEITKPAQFFFRYGQAGRETWKRFTGMEARLFMRGDAKVYVRLTNLAGSVLGSRGAAFFERTAQDLALGTAIESEQGQDALHATVRHTVPAKEQFRAWQKNASAWWLMNSSQLAMQPEQGPSSNQGEHP